MDLVAVRDAICHLCGDPEAILLPGYGRADVEELFAQDRLRAWVTTRRSAAGSRAC